MFSVDRTMEGAAMRFGLFCTLALCLCPLVAQNAAFDNDEKSLREAYEKVKNGPGESPEFAKGYRNLAEHLCAQSRYSEAEPLFAKLLEEREHAFGLNGVEIVPDLNDLARVAFAQMKFGVADGYWRRALQIVENTAGKQAKELVPLLENLSRASLAQDKAADAGKFLRRAVAIREKVNGAEDPALTQTLDLLGKSYAAEGKDAEAEQSWSRALRIGEKTAGQASLELAAPLSSLAQFYLNRQRFNDATPALRRELSIRESALGPFDASIPPVLDSLGGVFFQNKKYPEAAKAYERALFIRLKTTTNENPLTRMNVEKVAEVYAAQGRQAEAEPLYRQLLQAQESETVSSLFGLGKLLAAKDRTAEAESLFKLSIAILDTKGWASSKHFVLNPADPPPALLADVLDEYASLLKKMKKKGDAVKMEARARQLAGKPESAQGKDKKHGS